MTAIWLAEERGEFAPFDPVASFWRAECLNLFAMGELAVANCLEAMREAKAQLDPESAHPAHVARMRALSQAFSIHAFAGHSKVAAARLEDWQHLHDGHRLWLAHGVMTVVGAAADFRLFTYLSGERKDMGVKRYERAEMRELLNRQVLNELKWCDTRDMTADGHTKGSVSREALLQLMNGHFKYKHATQSTSPPTR